MRPSSPPVSIADRVAMVREEVARACQRSGRDPASVALVGVTKTYPIAAVAEALAAGLTDFGENRAQELLPKARAAASMGLQPRWHFIGHLQRNKVREVLPCIAALHSLDSVRLADEIERTSPRAAERGAAVRLPCYLEVNIAGEETKQGLAPAALPALLEALATRRHIEVVGLMTIAPRVTDPEQVRPVFKALRQLAAAHGLAGLSMGMSEDYRVAVEEGATVVRIGRALFGARA